MVVASIAILLAPFLALSLLAPAGLAIMAVALAMTACLLRDALIADRRFLGTVSDCSSASILALALACVCVALRA